MNLEELYEIDPYSLKHDQKEKVLLDGLAALTRHHQSNCQDYAQIIDVQGKNEWGSVSDIPFIVLAFSGNIGVPVNPNK